MKTKNIFQNLPIDLKDEFFENLLLNKNLKIERIVSYGQNTPINEWLVQQESEFVILLSGAAKLIFYDNNEIVEMQAGDYILIPSNTKHRVEWTDENNHSVWLAVHFFNSMT